MKMVQAVSLDAVYTHAYNVLKKIKIQNNKDSFKNHVGKHDF